MNSLPAMKNTKHYLTPLIQRMRDQGTDILNDKLQKYHTEAAKVIREADDFGKWLLGEFKRDDLDVQDLAAVSLTALRSAEEYKAEIFLKQPTLAPDKTEWIEPLYYERAVQSFFDEMNGAIIRTTSSLDEMMSHTDIDKVPARLLIPPYEACYIQFGEPIATIDAGWLATGAIVFSKIHHNYLCIEIITIASHLNDPLEVLTGYEILRPIDIDLDDGIVSVARKDMSFNVVNPQEDKDFEIITRKIFKTFLYMSLKEARLTHVNQRSILEKKLSSVGAKKRGKVEGRLEKACDYIQVGPEFIENDTRGYRNSGSSMPVHWRRGHIRNQRSGQGLTDSHIVWIKPVLVNARTITSTTDEVSPKNYIVGK